MRPLLLLVDLQNDFLSAPGLEPAGPEIVRRAARLLCGARARSVPVVHAVTAVDPESDDRMPHWKALGRWKCVAGTPGQAAPEPLRPEGGEAVVRKTFFSGFSTGALDRALARARADTLLVAGVHLHGCVRATVLDAYQRGLAVWVAEDAVGSDDPLHAAVTRRYLEDRAARFAPVEELLARLSEGDPAVRPGRPPALAAAVIAGRELRGEGLPAIDQRSPRETARVLFAVPRAGRSEAAEAAAAAGSAREGWEAIPSEERSRILARLADRIEGEAGALARDLAVEVGKPVAQGLAEARRAAALVRAAAAAGEGGRVACGPESAWRRLPLGVVAVVTPWNNPLAIPFGKIAPAVAHGNAVVWKPAPAATRAAMRALDLMREAGLPAGLVNLVAGDHRTAAAVMSDPGVDAVSLSGSSLAGWAAQEICARRRIPLQAELGGNNASVVWEGADLEKAAELIARGAFCFAGQRCTANRRAVVEERLFEPFVERLTNATANLRWGDPLDPATEVGPLVSEEARERVEAAVARAAPQAERVLSPHAQGAVAHELRGVGAYHPPTIVVAGEPDSEVVQEETFGPVLVVQRARGFENALDLVNGVRQGLVAALFAGPGPWRRRFWNAARAGVLKWNAATADADAAAPFGGWKASGLGPPEHGPGNAEFYTRIQAIYGEA
ncbi:MAG: aldehyde dehydrogenase family protein [Acidobacteriota bacterium]